MEDIRDAALAYYEHLSEEQKQIAADCFKTVDKSGKGKVSLREYAEFFKQIGFAEVAYPDFFKSLDSDGNGSLDFNEFVTVYYLWCFEGSGDTYDLCCACYHNKNIDHHQGAKFRDNYALLRQQRKVEASATASQSSTNQASESRRKKTPSDVIQTAKLGLSTVNFATNTAPKLWENGKEAFQEIGCNSSDSSSVVDSAFNIADLASNAADVATSCIIM